MEERFDATNSVPKTITLLGSRNWKAYMSEQTLIKTEGVVRILSSSVFDVPSVVAQTRQKLALAAAAQESIRAQCKVLEKQEADHGDYERAAAAIVSLYRARIPGHKFALRSIA